MRQASRESLKMLIGTQTENATVSSFLNLSDDFSGGGQGLWPTSFFSN